MTDADIDPDTIRSLSVLYYAAMLEELRAFEVVDALLEQLAAGALPIRGPGGSLLKLWMERGPAPSAKERRQGYLEAFGRPGEAGGSQNREFDALWRRFVAAVAALAGPAAGADQRDVRDAARALATNLSDRRGLAPMARVVRQQVNLAIDVLSDHEIQAAFGARNIPDLIARLSAVRFGSARNSERAFAMARSGVTVFVWLAKRADELAAAAAGPLLDLDRIRRDPRPPGASPTTDPTDADLVNACERWLAVAGVDDDGVEELAHPRRSSQASARG